MEINEMNIYQRIHAVTSEIGKVQMTLNVDTGKSTYKAISINDVVDALLPLLEKYRLVAMNLDKEIIDQRQVTTTTKYGDRSVFFVRLKSKVRIVNIDNPEEFVEGCGFGDGVDSGDKACGKADTYARKYAMISIFNLSKGEDSDEKASEEYKQIPPVEKDQIAKIQSLYTEKEIGTMLKRMKKASLESITYEQASKMIAKRDQSLLADPTPTF